MYNEELGKIVELVYSLKYNPYLDIVNNIDLEANNIYSKDSSSLSDIKGDLISLNNLVQKIKNVDVNLVISDIKEEIIKRKEKETIDLLQKAEEISDKYEGQANALVDKTKADALTHNDCVVADVNSFNEKFVKLEKKRKALQTYNDEIVSIVKSYGITTSDISFDSKDLSYEDLSQLYDESIAYMEKHKVKANPIRVFRELFPQEEFQAIVLVICLFLCFTIILDFISVFFYSLYYYFYIKSEKHNGFIITIYGLLNCLNPMDFCKEVQDGDLINVDEIDEESIEGMEEIATQWEAELSEYDLDALNERYNLLLIELSNNSQIIDNEIKEKLNYFIEEKEGTIAMIKQMASELKAKYDNILDSVEKLGDNCKQSYVFDTKLLLGLKDGVENEYVDVGLSNILIRPSKNKEEQQRFIMCLLANAMMNVFPGSLEIFVYDPNNLGRDVITLYDAEIDKYFHLDNPSLEVLLRDLTLIVKSNMKLFKSDSINAYNEASVKVGRTTKGYKLLLVLSQPKKIEEDEALIEFMSYSAKYGVLVWMVTDKDIHNTYVFNKPFEGVTSPYPIEVESFGNKVSSTLTKAIENAKTPSLLWEDFIKVAVPDESFWTYSCDEYIDLDPGFWEGDPTLYKGYTVGNEGNIHAITVGGTGAGKSVFLNNLIANSTSKYSPFDYELWLIDFKGVEFSFYLGEHMLPHIKACLCTSDGDYAGSVFKALRKEAEYRYDEVLKKNGFKNIYTYNTWLRQQGRDSEIIKRIQVICDEFQVIFEKAEENVKAQIIADITYISKVARAAGIHLHFASQSMKKTVSDDILQQFTLRFALRCDKEVSMSVLGTNFAGNIKQKNGYLYVRSMDDVSLEAQKMYRTPFIPDEVLRTHIRRCCDEAKKRGYVQSNVITYQESTVHPISEIYDFYEKHRSAIPCKAGSFLLGMNMVYSENLAPHNIILSPTSNSHIVSAFSITTDLVQFYKSLIANMNCFEDQDYTLMINCQSNDLHYLCGIDEIEDEAVKMMSTADVSIYTIMDFLEASYKARKDNPENKPAYIILIGWDKAVGFGIDKDMSLVNRMASLMKLCGTTDMHIIFIFESMKDIATGIKSSTNTLIAGRCDSDTSFAVTSNKLASKVYDGMKDGYMFVNNKGEISRVKIYVSELTREIKQTEIVIKDR